MSGELRHPNGVANARTWNDQSFTITNVDNNDGLAIGDTMYYSGTTTPMGIVTEVNDDTTVTCLLQGEYVTTPEPNRSGRLYPRIDVMERDENIRLPLTNTIYDNGYNPSPGVVRVNGPYINGNEVIIGNEEHPEFIKLCDNGDIIIKGHKIENDICLVDAMREFLSGQGLYNR